MRRTVITAALVPAGPARATVLLWAGLALVVGLLFAGSILTGRAPGADMLVSVARLDDPGRDMTLQEVTQARFTPASPQVEMGFSRSVRWLRLEIDAPADGQDLVLRVRPTLVDHLTLYIPDGSGWRSVETGDRIDPVQRSWPAILRQAMVIEAPPAEGQYYLRIDTDSPSALFLSALPLADAVQAEIRNTLFHSLVFAIKFFSVVLVMLLLPLRDNGLNLGFIALQVSYILFLIFSLGYAQALLPGVPAPVMDWLTSGSVILAIGTGCLFHRSFLMPFDPHPMVARLSIVPACLVAAGAILLVLGLRQEGMQLALGGFALLVPMLVGMLATLRQDVAPGRRTVRRIYGIYTAALVLELASTFGWAQMHVFYRNVGSVMAIINSTLILSLLAIVNLARERAWQARQDEFRRIALERESGVEARRSQQYLMRIVATETYAALSDIRAMIRAQPAAVPRQQTLNRALAGLEAIIGHCVQADRVEQGAWRIDPGAVGVEHLVRALCLDHRLDERAVITVAGDTRLVTDRNLLRTVMGHLLMNAARYAPAQSPIALRLERRQDGGRQGVQITMTNQTDAPDAFDPARVFDKFYRGGSSRATGGTGLGLFIAREIIQALGGSIAATVSGHEVRFTLFVPDLR